jgi:hypothetical protein
MHTSLHARMQNACTRTKLPPCPTPPTWTRSWNLSVSQHTSTGLPAADAIIATAALPARDTTVPLLRTAAAPRMTLVTWGWGEGWLISQ